MKIVIRAFVLSLVVTGAFASVHINNATAKTTLHASSNAYPVPACPPNDPKACNICSIGGCIAN
jgi:hypothetical protein